jgi:hypothetical protein
MIQGPPFRRQSLILIESLLKRMMILASVLKDRPGLLRLRQLDSRSMAYETYELQEVARATQWQWTDEFFVHLECD